MAPVPVVGRLRRPAARLPPRHLRYLLAISISLSLGEIGECDSFVIQQKSWDYNGHYIGWEVARRTHDDGAPNPGGGKGGAGVDVSPSTDDVISEEDPVLLLNGFGVGSFHQHRLMPELVSFDRDAAEDDAAGGDGGKRSRAVYGVDYLGQGRSWPVDCDDGNSENERGLRYCIDTWADQIIRFVEEVILPRHSPRRADGSRRPKVHLVGNSVGGHLSVLLASKRPDLVGSVCLLNATPVWGLNLPGWSGRLPPPAIPRIVGRYLFDRIRDPSTIEQYLASAYANRDAFDEELVQGIRACTEGKGGHAAFASILWSPPATFSGGPERTEDDFYSNLSKLPCDALLVFGRDDPWCKPAFARRMARALGRRPEEATGSACHRYIELDNVGHCPNHEAPRAVGKAVRRWINALESGQQGSAALTDGEMEVVVEPTWGGQVTMHEITVDGGDGGMWADISLMDRLVSRFI